MKSVPPAQESPVQFEQARWLTDELKPHEVALRGYLLNTFPSVDADEVIQESYLKLLKARALGRIVFWSDDPEGFVRLLESGFGVSAQRLGDTIRLTGQ